MKTYDFDEWNDVDICLICKKHTASVCRDCYQREKRQQEFLINDIWNMWEAVFHAVQDAKQELEKIRLGGKE
jgi:hypothetical protein